MAYFTKIFVISVIVLMTINLTLTTYQKNSPPTWTQQQNNNPVLVHFIEVPDRHKCPANQRRDKFGTCRPVYKYS